MEFHLSFSPQYRFETMLKSKRKKSPYWLDFRPRGFGSRNYYELAAKYEGRFARAFMTAVKDTLPERIPSKLKEAWDKEDLYEAIAAVPVLDGGQDTTEAQRENYKRFEAALVRAYSGLLKESGQAAAENMNKLLGVNFGFTISDGSNAEILKADEDVFVNDRWLTPIVPVNPYSKRWMETRAMELVTQGITAQQHETARMLLQDGFERGLRIERLYPEIRANIGLLPRELKAVGNRRALLVAEGIPEGRIDKLVAKYSQQLLRKRAERIARTETITAQAAGRRQMWQLAEESGELPKVQRRWMSAPGSDNPDRPCEICLDLDGKTAPINGQYESLEGPIDGPTAHPGCRCGETLERVK